MMCNPTPKCAKSTLAVENIDRLKSLAATRLKRFNQRPAIRYKSSAALSASSRH